MASALPPKNRTSARPTGSSRVRLLHFREHTEGTIAGLARSILLGDADSVLWTSFAAVRESANGTFETSTDVRYTAAFRGKPDISQRLGPLWSAASLHYS
jgi:hypothetical protein